MLYHCKLCDKSIINKSKYSHSKSITHKTLDESIIRRYIILDHIFDQIDEIMKRYINIFNKKYEKHSVSCVLKLLTTTLVIYIRINTKHNLDFFNCSKISMFSRINQNRYYFCHIYEMRITFSSSFTDMTYDYYLKEPLPMFEIRLIQLLAKNPRLICRLNRYSDNAYIKKFTHQWIKIANERN